MQRSRQRRLPRHGRQRKQQPKPRIRWPMSAPRARAKLWHEESTNRLKDEAETAAAAARTKRRWRIQSPPSRDLAAVRREKIEAEEALAALSVNMTRLRSR